MNRPSMKKIAVLIDPDDLHLSGYLRGIRDFARESGQWILHGIDLPCYHEIFDFKNWTGDGCLAFNQSEKSPSTSLFRNCPHQVTLGKITEGTSSISFDEQQGITNTLQHLAGQGCRSITFHGPSDPGKISTIIRLCDKFDLRFVATSIRSLQPSPAIIVPDCQHALEALRIAAQNNSPPPFIVSLGDDANCRLSSPGITSLAYPSRELGYRAAQLLDHHLRGETSVHHLTLRTPKLNIRGSSQHQRLDDKIVQKALGHIRLLVGHTPLRVVDLADAVGLSRTSLTERFQKQLGLPPADVIRQERLTIAKRELGKPGEMVKSVAYSMGFSSSQEFARFFKNATGKTPSEFVESKSRRRNEPLISKLHQT